MNRCSKTSHHGLALKCAVHFSGLVLLHCTLIVAMSNLDHRVGGTESKSHHKAAAVLVPSTFLEVFWRCKEVVFFTAALSPTVGSASPRSLAKSPRGPCRKFCHLKNRKIILLKSLSL